MDVFALDFDGVICDSARETAVSAWRAAGRFWPDLRGAEPPPDALEGFVTVRPVLETGYQAPVLMRLVARGIPTHDILADFAQLYSKEVADCTAPREQLLQVFGETRDRWIAQDPADWLSRHRFYPGVIPALRRAMELAPIYILTTKQERFARELLNSATLDFPCDRLFGLESGRTKEGILAELVQAPASRGHTFHFVEDRLQTLERVIDCPVLADVRLYLATWGYCTADGKRTADAHHRITLWDLPDFLKFDEITGTRRPRLGTRTTGGGT